MSTTALVLIAHGSRREEANSDLRQIAGELSQSVQYRSVEASFLELATPTIPEAAEACVESGAKRVVLVPYFLSAGVHVRQDLQAHRTKIAERHPGVAILLAEPIGLHPAMKEIVEQRALEAITASEAVE